MTKTAILKEDLPKQDFFLVELTITLKNLLIKFSYIYIYLSYKK